MRSRVREGASCRLLRRRRIGFSGQQFQQPRVLAELHSGFQEPVGLGFGAELVSGDSEAGDARGQPGQQGRMDVGIIAQGGAGFAGEALDPVLRRPVVRTPAGYVENLGKATGEEAGLAPAEVLAGLERLHRRAGITGKEKDVSGQETLPKSMGRRLHNLQFRSSANRDYCNSKGEINQRAFVCTAEFLSALTCLSGRPIAAQRAQHPQSCGLIFVRYVVDGVEHLGVHLAGAQWIDCV